MHSMTKRTIYGLPLNPTHLLNQLKGASFCISYATRQKLGKQLDQAIDLVGENEILLIDNGAFSAHQAGIDTMADEDYLEGFAEWANEILDRCPQAIAVLPDVIGGTHEQNAQLVCETMTMFPQERTMPIWHLHEPIEYLLYLCESFSYIGFGSSGEYWQAGTEKWHARIKKAFAAIDRWESESEGAYIRPRIHMMRAQAFAHLYPFDSSDSTNIAMNHNRQFRKAGEDIAAFAERVSGKISDSATGIASEHQRKRPLLAHIEDANLETIWLLEQHGYQVREPLELPPVTPPPAPPAAPLVVAYGMGVDSTAVLVGLQQRGERPDLILFADTGDEKPETYAYLPIINAWLDRVGFPQVTVVKNPRPKSGDKSLSESCMRNRVLPALAYRQHQCSLVWKRDPQMKFIKQWAPAKAAWASGQEVVNCIGYDAGPRDSCRSYKAEGKAAPGMKNRFPLIEWGWDRARCQAEIKAAGLPVPIKSACFFCPASKRDEIDWLKARHPDLAARAIEMEQLAKARGLKSIKGLGISFSWGEYLA